MLISPRRVWLAKVIPLPVWLRRLDLIRLKIDTNIATRNIAPRIQKDIASFEIERQSVPSDASDRTRGGYSSTKSRTKMQILEFVASVVIFFKKERYSVVSFSI